AYISLEDRRLSAESPSFEECVRSSTRRNSMKCIPNFTRVTQRSNACNGKVLTRIVTAGAVATCLLGSVALTAQNNDDTQPFLPNPVRSVSTVPANGDVNPYGVAFVPADVNVGLLHAGDILVSNFNNEQNLQGTGTTIVRVSSKGKAS